MSNLTARLESPYLYCLADTSYGTEQLPSRVKAAVAGGAKLFQLRAKGVAEEELVVLGKAIKQELQASASDNLLIINDHPQICKLVNADGVHLGAEDLSPQVAREMLGDNAIIGATIHNIKEAENMSYKFVDYVGIGPVFASPTKKNLLPLSGQELRELITTIRISSGPNGNNSGNNNGPQEALIKEASKEVPIICIGGIEQNNMQLLQEYDIDGIAVASAIANPATTKSVCEKMLRQIQNWR